MTQKLKGNSRLNNHHALLAHKRFNYVRMITWRIIHRQPIAQHCLPLAAFLKYLHFLLYSLTFVLAFIYSHEILVHALKTVVCALPFAVVVVVVV